MFISDFQIYLQMHCNICCSLKYSVLNKNTSSRRFDIKPVSTYVRECFERSWFTVTKHIETYRRDLYYFLKTSRSIKSNVLHKYFRLATKVISLANIHCK